MIAKIRNYSVSKLICLISILAIFAVNSVGLALAQSAENGIPKIDWQKKIEADEKLSALDFSLMGETIDMHTGGISFSHTDVSLPGNSSLDVSVRRSRKMGQLYHLSVNTDFGDWSLDVPRIDAIVGPSSPWKQDSGDRCSAYHLSFPQEQVTIPTKAYGDQDQGGFIVPGSIKFYEGEEYSNGIAMTIPGQGTQAVLRTWGGTDKHTVPDAKYTTTTGWYFTCIDVGNNEGFEAVSPQGHKYIFDKVITRRAKDLEFFDHDPDSTNLHRWVVSLRATRVEDAHGNWVEYDYNAAGELTAITARDGRAIDLEYTGGLITKVVANEREWLYGYETNSYQHRFWEGHSVAGPGNKILTEVTRPDLLKWTYGLAEMTAGPQPGEYCATTARFLTVQHPNGASGIFTVNDVMHRTSLDARTWAPRVCGPYNTGFHTGEPGCDLDCQGANPSNPIQRLKRISVVSVLSKSIIYSNNTSSVWNYSYESDEGPESSSADDRTNWTKVVDPGGHETTYFHKWHRERDGGALIRKEFKDTPGGNVLSTEEYEYEFPNAGGAVDDTIIRAGLGLGGIFEDDVNLQPCGADISCFVSGHNDTPTNKPGVIQLQTKVTSIQDGDTNITATQYGADRLSASYSWGNSTQTILSSDLSSDERKTVTTYKTPSVSEWFLGLPLTITTNDRSIPDLETTYNSKGQIISQSKLGHLFATYGFDSSSGTAEWIEDSLGRRTKAQDWHRGIPKTIISPGSDAAATDDDLVVYQTVDNNGWVMATTDARGFQSQYSRDNMGRLTIFDPPGDYYDSTFISYDFTGGGAVQTITKGGATRIVTYDELLRPTLAESSTTGWVSYVNKQYDVMGRLKFESQPSISPLETKGTDYAYDVFGRVKSKTQTYDTNLQILYDYLSDNKSKVSDAEGNYTITWKNAFDEVIRIDQPENTSTTIIRDAWGKILSATQFDHTDSSVSKTQTYVYDGRDRVCRHHTPSGGSALFSYDNVGQLLASSRGHIWANDCSSPSGSAQVNYAYDAMGRLTFTNYSAVSTPDTVRTYDENGNLKALYREDGGEDEIPWYQDPKFTQWTYNYDELGKLTQEKLLIDWRVFSSDYLYMPNGAMESSSRQYRHAFWPEEHEGFRHTIEYSRDGMGRGTGVTLNGDGQNIPDSGLSLASEAIFHPSGALHQLAYGNDQAFIQTLNARLQPQHMLSAKSGGVTALDLFFEYDNRGFVSHMGDGLDSDNDRDYTYDGQGRLKTASGPWWGNVSDGSFEYDALGNILEKTLGTRQIDLTYNSQNRLKQSDDTGDTGTRNFTYDNRGNVTSVGGVNMNYDASERPTGLSGDVTGSYRYDGHGRRVKSITVHDDNTKTTRYNVYDISGTLVYVVQLAPGTESDNVTNYIKLNGTTIARVKSVGTRLNYNDELTWLHHDNLGSAVAGSDINGELVWKEKFTPYGITLVNNSFNDDQAGYTGHLKDSDTGLTYMQARYYDPIASRFLSHDPVQFSTENPLMFNRFSYALGNPVNAIDPNGEESFFVSRRLPGGYHHAFVIVTNDKGRVVGQFSYGPQKHAGVTGLLLGGNYGKLTTQLPLSEIHTADLRAFRQWVVARVALGEDPGGTHGYMIDVHDETILAAGEAVNNALGTPGRPAAGAPKYSLWTSKTTDTANSNSGSNAVKSLAYAIEGKDPYGDKPRNSHLPGYDNAKNVPSTQFRSYQGAIYGTRAAGTRIDKKEKEK